MRPTRIITSKARASGHAAALITLAWLASAAASPPDDRLEEIAHAASMSDTAALVRIVGEKVAVELPREMGTVAHGEANVGALAGLASKCPMTNLHHGTGGTGYIDWTCGAIPTEGGDCGPKSYRLVARPVATGDKVRYLLVSQDIMAPDPCVLSRKHASIGLKVGDDPHHMAEWFQPAKNQSNPTPTDWREARNFTAAVMEKRSGTRFGAVAYTLFSNPYADWQDGSTVATNVHYADFSQALQGCRLKDLVALDAPYLGDSAGFAASFLCPHRGNNYPLVLMSFSVTHGALARAFLYRDQPQLVYSLSPRGSVAKGVRS